MAIHTTKNGEIKKADDGGGGDLAGLLRRMGGEIARALPKHVNPDRMARVMLTALRTVPGLSECTPASFLGCVITLSQLGLEPNTPLGLAYLIPRRNKGTMECTAIIGYQGFLDLGRRGGATVYAHTVHAGDEFAYELGLRPDLRHVPKAEDRSAVTYTHVYAVARMRDGEPIFVVLTRAEVDARRKRSAAGSNGPWVTDHLAMVRKTAVRALWTWMPKSVEMMTAEVVDHASDVGRAAVPELDDQTARALLSAGVAMPQEPVETAGETVDAETGEVTP
jgi:recombination protein RecT